MAERDSNQPVAAPTPTAATTPAATNEGSEAAAGADARPAEVTPDAPPVLAPPSDNTGLNVVRDNDHDEASANDLPVPTHPSGAAIEPAVTPENPGPLAGFVAELLTFPAPRTNRVVLIDTSLPQSAWSLSTISHELILGELVLAINGAMPGNYGVAITSQPGAEWNVETLAPLLGEPYTSVMLVQVARRGTAVDVKLGTVVGSQLETTRRLLGDRYITHRIGLVVGLLAALAAVLSLLAIWTWRRAGRLTINCKLPAAFKQVSGTIEIHLTQGDRGLLIIPEPASYLATELATPPRQGRMRGTRLPAQTHWRVTPGEYLVTVGGAYRRGDEVMVLASQQQHVQVRFGRRTIELDLRSELARCDVTLVGTAPAVRAKVYLADSPIPAVAADATGHAVVLAPPGAYTLVIDVGGKRHRLPVELSCEKPCVVSHDVRRTDTLATGAVAALAPAAPAPASAPESALAPGSGPGLAAVASGDTKRPALAQAVPATATPPATQAEPAARVSVAPDAATAAIAPQPVVAIEASDALTLAVATTTAAAPMHAEAHGEKASVALRDRIDDGIEIFAGTPAHAGRGDGIELLPSHATAAKSADEMLAALLGAPPQPNGHPAADRDLPRAMGQAANVTPMVSASAEPVPATSAAAALAAMPSAHPPAQPTPTPARAAERPTASAAATIAGLGIAPPAQTPRGSTGSLEPDAPHRNAPALAPLPANTDPNALAAPAMLLAAERMARPATAEPADAGVSAHDAAAAVQRAPRAGAYDQTMLAMPSATAAVPHGTSASVSPFGATPALGVAHLGGMAPAVASPSAAMRGGATDDAEQSGKWPTDDSHEKTAAPGSLLFDRYRVRRVLGRGAMGIVLHAWDHNLDRDVAIKLMARELRARPDMVERFTQEAKALAKLRHTNIVSIFDQVVDQGNLYLIMEFVEGESLAAMLARRTSLPAQEACGLIAQLCAGLHYAHARNIIHRDIKPANVFVTHDGIPKLGDFGLAKIAHEVVIRRTEVRGTPAYMAPEQVQGKNVTQLVDVYAIATLAYKLFAGRTPFVEGNLLYAQMHNEAPPVTEFVTGVPEPLVLLLQRALAKNPDERPSAEDMARAFKRFA